MALYPKATKTSLAKLLRARGMDIPSIRRADFSKSGRSYWFHWQDSQEVWHQAYYSAAGGRPLLAIDQEFVPISMTEVIQFGLSEEK